jgi:carboxyl-terminal processing protease
VPQLSDPDYKDRPRVREADLRRHLLSEGLADEKLLEQADAATDDPRFLMTAADLKKQGVEDFQLDYAIKTLKRLGLKPTSIASASGRPKSR